MVRNHYLLLGIPTDATAQQIKSAYRSLAKRFHPDHNKGSETATDLFRQINDAYKVLADPAARAAYDKTLQVEQKTQKKVKPAIDPQQKFSNFLSSLLDAVIGPQPETVATAPVRPQRQAVRRPRQRPDFNACFSNASEKSSPGYDRGSDGVYRRVKKRKPNFSHRNGF